jgi:hypothetical protein
MIVPTHIDLHPHNLLINPKIGPVFVDIDSLQRADRVQNIGFATFKLVRQYIVHEQIFKSYQKIKRDTRCFIDIVTKTAQIEEINCNDICLLATAEVLRRLALIIDLNRLQGNRAWNTVLHMHLMALHEIPLMFDSS